MSELRKLAVLAASAAIAYSLSLAAFAALYLIGSATGPILYTYPAGRAAYNVTIAALNTLAFLASMLASATLLGERLGREWCLRYAAAPTLPFIALIGYLIASPSLPAQTALTLYMAGAAYSRLVIFVIAPTTLAHKVLGPQRGGIAAALAGAAAGAAAYALTHFAMPPLLSPAYAAAGPGLAPFLGGIAPAVAVVVEASPLALAR